MANDSHSSTVYVKWSSFRGGTRHQNSWRDIKRGAVESGHGWMWVWASHGWEIVHNERGCSSRRETAAQKRCLRSQQKGSESVSTKYPSTHVKKKQEAQQEEPREGESRKRWRKGNRERLAQLYCVRKITLRAEGDKTWGSVSSNHINPWIQRYITTLRVESVFECVRVFWECFAVSLCANYVTFPTVRVFFVRWGKARGECWNKALSRCVCVFHSVCLDVRGSWYSADQVPTMAPAPHKDRKRYRGQKQTERKREGKADGGEDRWDEREREMKAERTWGGEEECYIFCAPANKNEKKKCALPLLS